MRKRSEKAAGQVTQAPCSGCRFKRHPRATSYNSWSIPSYFDETSPDQPVSSGGGAGGDREVGGSSQPHLPNLLPPLLPTADCPPKGKEEHQQTETLPVMDKNTLLHHTHHIQWVCRVILPDLFRWKRKSTRTRELRWQLSGFAEGKLLRGEEWNSDTFCHKSGPWSAFEWHKILSLNRKFWETLSIANFQSMPRRYRLFFCSNQGILAW